MNSSTFLLLNFIVGFVADVALNDMSRYSDNEIMKSLQLYFREKSIVEAAVYAGITVVAVVLMIMYVTKKVYGFHVPGTNNQLLYSIIVSFVLGFVADIVIDKLKIFGSTLDEYYRIAGAGLWGALAIVMSVIVSYIVQKYLLPIL